MGDSYGTATPELGPGPNRRAQASANFLSKKQKAAQKAAPKKQKAVEKK
jgi:hypothetical protein